MNQDLERLRSIKSFPSLVKYLRNELDWPIESDDVEDLSFDYQPQELGLDPKTVVKIKEIKQLRPFVTNQPWGIFYVNFEPKRLPIVALRRILRSLVVKKRASANKSQQRAWQQNDLLFISAYGETLEREISFAHFSEDSEMGDLPTLKVLGWNTGNTILRLEDTHSTLKEKLHWPKDEDDTKEWRERWSSAFKLKYRETVRTSRDLAVKLADLASDIRIRVNEVLAVESEQGELRKLYKAFQEALIHDLSEDDFADMYAQTIAYGLLTASISRQSGGLVADNLKDMVPNTNPFLKELMQTFLTVGGRKNKIDFDELGINEVVDLLRHTQMDEVLKDFGAKNPQEDPVIHFYELFLKEYDPEKRMKRGVFYTPRPVVSFIVRSVDEILRTEFGLEDGLADTTTWGEMAKRSVPRAERGDTCESIFLIPEGVKPDEPFVQILDPATGTGTFLVEVIDVIHATMTEKWQKQGKTRDEIYELWNNYVPRHLLPRVLGFELMMAPYAIAHMKIGLKLRETRYSFLSSERARVYLTNTLEEPKDFSSYFEQMAPALAHEAYAANEIKRNAPITVIIGNPPYSKLSSNWNEWIDGLLHGRNSDGSRTSSYYECDDAPLGERTVWIQDDYVKFMRFSHWHIDRAGSGIHAYITNNGYIDNPTLRGMREQLRSSFQDLFVLDLHGSTKRRDKAPDGAIDKNVFDIQQGVAIGIFTKTAKSSQSSVAHSDLRGDRESKYRALISSKITDFEGVNVNPTSPFYLYVPTDATYEAEYKTGWKVTEIFRSYHSGIITKRDSLTIHFSAEEAFRTVSDFASLSPDEARRKYKLPADVRDWKVEWAQADLRDAGVSRRQVIPVLYRPYDIRFTYFTGRSRGFVGWPVADMTRLMLSGQNLALVTTRMTKGEKFAHSLLSRQMVEVICLSANTSNNGFAFPLYSTPTPRDGLFKSSPIVESNFKSSFIERLSDLLGVQHSGRKLDPKGIFHFIVAVIHSPIYRERYREFLSRDFPRIPLTSDSDLFHKLRALGGDLVALHLLDDDYDAASWNLQTNGKSPFNPPIALFAGRGSAEVAKGYPKFKDGNVYINPSRYFDGVPEEVWKFYVGGYQVCEKWLKYRRGRTLDEEDINHYQRVVVALNETIRLMAEIDRVIEEYGGWPLVGSQDFGALSIGSSSTEPATKNEESLNKEHPLPFE